MAEILKGRRQSADLGDVRIKTYPCPTPNKLPYKHFCTLERISYRLDSDMPLAGQEIWKTIHKRKRGQPSQVALFLIYQSLLLKRVKLAFFLVLLYSWLLLYTK